MGRYLGPVCRFCRREGTKLYLKGNRCFSPKCAMEEGRRPDPPGEKHFGRKSASDYKVQLREKQKAKRIYGISERQFSNYFAKANQKVGVTGELLLQSLERRMDNVVYRMGFATSRSHARQLVRHGHFLVNGKKVDIPSYQLRPGMQVEVREGRSKKGPFQEIRNLSPEEVHYPWLEVDFKNLRGTFREIPRQEDLDQQIQAHLIVEFYSR
ncbi:MAG: 30S ribosomal protein S4 [bacterium]|nr:30S ribosomal protein S4 [bacterium]